MRSGHPARGAVLAAALAAMPALSGCARSESWPLWLNSYSIQGALAIIAIPFVLYGIYKYGGDDDFGGGGG